ncbi:hypothetical protein HS088_TW06G01112 [Tripterygium wilfordii]|uniref:Uncharacterized protein n=1 Tax=Tripterygium wilfordii TaxID=458696 RepID=A0A7J7DLH1_TRIWF|nr:30S ribosomal protein S21, chloroplastic [Tripterygium wilfordii]KAF5746936.1 hypothetical protein HS088_TW06G01112 [Tripterygium wilfordii]
MATSFSLSNLLSFLPPSPPKALLPSPQLLNLSISTQKSRFLTLVARDGADGIPPLSSDVSSIICPSLAYANTLYFKSAYNVQVIVDENEPEERLLNRFRREVMRAGVIQESKRRRFFENKQEEKKRKTREAAKRNRRRRPMARTMFQNKEEPSTKKKDDDDEDNWEVPEGGLP